MRGLPSDTAREGVGGLEPPGPGRPAPPALGPFPWWPLTRGGRLPPEQEPPVPLLLGLKILPLCSLSAVGRGRDSSGG